MLYLAPAKLACVTMVVTLALRRLLHTVAKMLRFVLKVDNNVNNQNEILEH